MFVLAVEEAVSVSGKSILRPCQFPNNYCFLFLSGKQRLGVAHTGAATILKKEAIENKDEPRWIYIDEERLSNVESFLLKNSVLSQQLYNPQKYQQLISPLQPFQASQNSVAVKDTFPGSSTPSQLQTQKDDTSAGADKIQEFWKDSEIVKDEDFSNWEIPQVTNKESPNNANNVTSANSSAGCSVVKDIFSGSPWKPLSTEQHNKLDTQLFQEFSQRQNLLESELSWFNEQTKTLPVTNHR